MNAEYRAGYHDGLFGHAARQGDGDYADGYEEGAADRLALHSDHGLNNRVARAWEARYAQR